MFYASSSFDPEDMYKQRTELRKKYCTDTTYKAPIDFMYSFYNWFVSKLIHNQDTLCEAQRLSCLVLQKDITTEEALDSFCDYIKLDRTAWKLHLYRQRPDGPSSDEFWGEKYTNTETSTKLPSPKGGRFSLRLAGIPAEFNLSDSCFGAKGCARCAYSVGGCINCLRTRNMTFQESIFHNKFPPLRTCSKCRHMGCNICYQKARRNARMEYKKVKMGYYN